MLAAAHAARLSFHLDPLPAKGSFSYNTINHKVCEWKKSGGPSKVARGPLGKPEFD